RRQRQMCIRDSHYNGRTGLEAALESDWDAILLDLMLPELNGLEVCRRVRQVKNTPIIMMTARDSVIDRVSGLAHGADDYICLLYTSDAAA
ncbi:response regulator, partial [Enterococcus sp. S181_ASV_20]|nr:response regulator [Enterococcus sp. S181_ASV_20]